MSPRYLCLKQVFAYIQVTRVAQSVYWLGYRLDIRGSILGRCSEAIFCLVHCVQTESGVRPASYTMGSGGKATGE
jgi:hypothetical protein